MAGKNLYEDHLVGMGSFEDVYESEGENSVLSSLSSYTDKNTLGSVEEPLSPLPVQPRTRVSSADCSLLSASPSASTLQMLKTPGSAPASSTPMMVLSRKKPPTSPRRTMIEVTNTPPQKTDAPVWNFDKLKIEPLPCDDVPPPVVSSPPQPPPTDTSPEDPEVFLLDEDVQSEAIAIPEKSDYLTGICKIWYVDKGFGFVRSTENNEEYFCHFTSIKKRGFKCLQDGDEVKFRLADNTRKPGAKMCIDVELIKF